MRTQPESTEISIVENVDPVAAVHWWRTEESGVAEFATLELESHVSERSDGNVPSMENTADRDVDPIASALATVPWSEGLERFPGDWLQTLTHAVAQRESDSFVVKTVKEGVILAGSTGERCPPPMICSVSWVSDFSLPNGSYYDRNAEQRHRELIERHEFDGIVLKSEWALRTSTPYEEFSDATALIEEYQTEWGA